MKEEFDDIGEINLELKLQEQEDYYVDAITNNYMRIYGILQATINSESGQIPINNTQMDRNIFNVLNKNGTIVQKTMTISEFEFQIASETIYKINLSNIEKAKLKLSGL